MRAKRYGKAACTIFQRHTIQRHAVCHTEQCSSALVTPGDTVLGQPSRCVGEALFSHDAVDRLAEQVGMAVGPRQLFTGQPSDDCRPLHLRSSCPSIASHTLRCKVSREILAADYLPFMSN